MKEAESTEGKSLMLESSSPHSKHDFEMEQYKAKKKNVIY